MIVHVTNHAVERYVERVRPGLDVVQARSELRTLLQAMGVQCDRPDWLPVDTRTDRVYIALGDDIVAACVDVENGKVLALTIYARGTLLAHERAKRNYDRSRKPRHVERPLSARALVARDGPGDDEPWAA